METPRLCIDMRACHGFKHSNLTGHELISQLIAARGEKESGFWPNRNRVVLLSYVNQVFAGQLKRHNTTVQLSSSLWSWFWTRHFVKTSGIFLFHRFRNLEQPLETFKKETITTLLPLESKWPSISKSILHSQTWITPSPPDRTEFLNQYAIPPHLVKVIAPSVRRAFYYVRPKQQENAPLVLILVKNKQQEKQISKLKEILRTRHGSFGIIIKYLDQWDLGLQEWMGLLSSAKLMFYLTDLPFDDGVLALEAIFSGVPTIFMDSHRALNHWIPQSAFRYNYYLAEEPSLEKLNAEVQHARMHLHNENRFNPLSLAAQYNQLFDTFRNETSSNEELFSESCSNI